MPWERRGTLFCVFDVRLAPVGAHLPLSCIFVAALCAVTASDVVVYPASDAVVYPGACPEL